MWQTVAIESTNFKINIKIGNNIEFLALSDRVNWNFVPTDWRACASLDQPGPLGPMTKHTYFEGYRP